MPAINRFSQLYLKRGTATSDSDRLRNRLRAFYTAQIAQHYNTDIKDAYETETGATVKWIGSYAAFRDVFTSAEHRDLLDAISVVYHVLRDKRVSTLAQNWFDFVNRALREENLQYILESDGAIHYFVDEEFQVNRQCTLIELGRPDLAAAKAAFEDAFKHLNVQSPDTKAALRSIFETAEIIAKLIITDTNNLNRSLVESRLKPLFLNQLTDDPHQSIVMEGMFKGLAAWVDAIHQYRHGQGVSLPIAPSIENAIHVISLGASYIRLLIPLVPQLEVYPIPNT